MRSTIRIFASVLVIVRTIPAEQPEVRKGPYGSFSSPNYPNEYDNDQRKEWVIRVPEGHQIKFRFTSFDLEESHGENSKKCVNDYVLITQGSETIGRFCGNAAYISPDAPKLNEWFRSKGNEIHVLFVSDYSNIGISPTGFFFEYIEEGIRCEAPLLDPRHGRIASQNSKGYYEFKNEVTFECDTGYNLIGNPTLECLSDGTWNASQPHCTIKSCGEPENLIAVSNSHIIDFPLKHFKYGEKVTVKCNDWYEMTAGVATWRCNERSEWVKESRMIAENAPSHYPKCRPRCGIKGKEDNSIIIPLIFGGKISLKSEWPWMAFLNFGRKNLRTESFACAGYLISPNYILTAASCVYRWDNHTHVWLGFNDRRDDRLTAKYVQADVILIHPKYHKASLWDFDVALIRLHETITMSDTIRPVCLPSTKEEFQLVKPGQKGEVSGWGLDGLSPILSRKLMHAKFPIVGHEECWDAFQSRAFETNTKIPSNFRLTSNMFCGGYREGSQSTCHGDAGAPFVMTKNGSSVYYAVGLVSFGIGDRCGAVVSYTGFARMNREIVQWIMDETNNLEG